LQPSYLHTDFNKWRDEDDSEAEDLGMDENNFEAVSNISNTRNSVSSHIQTPRRELKIRRAAEYF